MWHVPLFSWSHRLLSLPRSSISWATCSWIGTLSPSVGWRNCISSCQWKRTLKSLCPLQISQFPFAVWWCLFSLLGPVHGPWLLKFQRMDFKWWIMKTQKKYALLCHTLKEGYRPLKLSPFLSSCLHNSVNSVTNKLPSKSKNQIRSLVLTNLWRFAVPVQLVCGYLLSAVNTRC